MPRLAPVTRVTLPTSGIPSDCPSALESTSLLCLQKPSGIRLSGRSRSTATRSRRRTPTSTSRCTQARMDHETRKLWRCSTCWESKGSTRPTHSKKVSGAQHFSAPLILRPALDQFCFFDHLGQVRIGPTDLHSFAINDSSSCDHRIVAAAGRSLTSCWGWWKLAHVTPVLGAFLLVRGTRTK